MSGIAMANAQWRCTNRSGSVIPNRGSQTAVLWLSLTPENPTKIEWAAVVVVVVLYKYFSSISIYKHKW